MGDETKVCVIKIVTGEEIIGKLSMLSETLLELKDARVLLVDPYDAMSLGPVMFCAKPDAPCVFRLTNVVVESSEIRPDLEQAYLESVSALVLPKSSILHG